MKSEKKRLRRLRSLNITLWKNFCFLAFFTILLVGVICYLIVQGSITTYTQDKIRGVGMSVSGELNKVAGNANLATLFAAFLTYLCAKIFKNRVLQVGIGGIWPVILNAFIIPAVWILAGQSGVVYWYQFASMIITQSVWVYALGIPLYIAIYNLRKRGVRVFTSPVHAVQSTGVSAQTDMGGAQNDGGLPKENGDNAR